MILGVASACAAVTAETLLTVAVPRPRLRPCHLSGNATVPQQINGQNRILCTTRIGHKLYTTSPSIELLSRSRILELWVPVEEYAKRPWLTCKAHSLHFIIAGQPMPLAAN